MAEKFYKIPTESEEQQAVFHWAALYRCKFPELDLLFHIPNGGKRSKAEAGRFKAEGVKSGVPDICLPVPRGGHHGLYIELKRTKGSHTSDEQLAWLMALGDYGYAVCICKGHESAIRAIELYLKG